MKSQPGKETIATYTLPNILRSTDNQITKFGQLIDYSIRNIFFGKSYTKYGGETIAGPFSKKPISSIFLDHLPEVLYSLFLLYANLEAIEIY